MPYHENPYEAQCGRAYPRGHRLTAADRRALPDEAFGLIRGPGRGKRKRGYPMPDAVHAANAKSRAAAALQEGYLTRRQYDAIVSKANAILDRCGGILAPVVRFPGRRGRRVAANPGVESAFEQLRDVWYDRDSYDSDEEWLDNVGHMAGVLSRLAGVDY